MTQVLNERRFIQLIVLTQFIAMLDFVIVMPMGPDITRDLGIPLSQVGLLSSAYALAAASALVLLYRKLDSFNRRTALVFSIVGLSLASFAVSFSVNLYTLLVARAIAGIFGGLTSSFSMALIIDAVPQERRGWAVGKVAGAFSLAAVLGVPAGLQLSLWYSWQFAFQLLGLLGLVVAIFVWRGTSGSAIKRQDEKTAPPMGTGVNWMVILGLGCVTAGMLSCFLIIPQLAGYLQFNLGYERELIGSLYMVGGIITYLLSWLSGHMTDRFGSIAISCIGTMGFAAAVFTLLITPGFAPIPVIFSLFMGFNAIRTVSTQTLLMQIPKPTERAGFMALQNALRHIATGLAAAISSIILVQLPSGALDNTVMLGWLALATATVLPMLVWLLTYKLKKREVMDTAIPS